MIITARRLVKSQRKDVSGRVGNTAVMTCGIVSPIIMQKASIPPNALFAALLEDKTASKSGANSQRPLSHLHRFSPQRKCEHGFHENPQK